MQITGDALTAAHVVGLAAGLLVVLATWLIGIELYVDQPQGRGMAVAAAALAATCVAFLHFGRLAIYLPATAMGALGAWALLCGVRTGSRLTLLAAGLFAGLAVMFDRGGLAFVPVFALWWVGLWVLGRNRPREARRAGSVGLLLWTIGLFAAASPALINWLAHPGALMRICRAPD